MEIITGQNNLTYVHSKIYPGIAEEMRRIFEEEEETFEHILNECPRFISFWRNMMQGRPLINTLKWKAKTLLEFSHFPSIDEALSFGGKKLLIFFDNFRINWPGVILIPQCGVSAHAKLPRAN